MPSVVYLITGGTGSLGTALTLELLNQGHKVRAYARSEHGHEALEAAVPKEHHSRLSCLIGDVRDRDRLIRAAQGATYIIHAAAQKVIPLAEYNPGDCVKTNIQGTMNVIEAALTTGSMKALLVSTDKARSPSTLYGATKLCAERLWLAGNRYTGNEGIFSCVAYGNVWGSKGSVIEAFDHQRKTLGFLQVTEPEMTRFHITLPQAVSLVLRACQEAAPGTLWIPRLPSYRVGDLAQAYQRTNGMFSEPSIVGRRVAEKMHEELISETESLTITHEDSWHFVLDPRQPTGKPSWSYNSSSNRIRLSVSQLEEQILEWKASSRPSRMAPDAVASCTL